MTLEEAKTLLAHCKRHELRDHAFGDVEVGWELDGKEVASGYFGSGTPEVSIYGQMPFVGRDADELRSFGYQGAVERNDSTGPAEYAEGKCMPGLTPEGVLKELTEDPEGGDRG